MRENEHKNSALVGWWILGFLGLIGIFFTVYVHNSKNVPLPPESPPPKVSEGVLTSQCQSYNYIFTKDILCNGINPVHSVSADYVGFVEPDEPYQSGSDYVPKPKDITGDKKPDLIVVVTHGNCCVDCSMLSFGEQVTEYKFPIGGKIEILDLDRDGKYEIKAADTTLSPDEEVAPPLYEAPLIILEVKDQKYVLSERFMKRMPIPTKPERALLKDASGLTGIPKTEQSYVIEMIYAGRGDDAFQYLVALYDGTPLEEEKNEFLDELVVNLRGSAYWHEIGAMNHWKYTQPDDGEIACPELSGKSWLVKTK